MAEAVIILGLPRSGAGTVAGLAQQVGVYLGTQLIGPRKNFPRGLFEDRRVVGINRDLLAAFDQTGVAGFPLPVRWDATPAGRLARFRAEDVLADLAIGGTYALKDPRLTVTAPLWQAGAAAQGHKTRFVIAVRDPLDLGQATGQIKDKTGSEKRNSPAAVLAERQRFVALWLAQSVQMLALSAGHPRVFVGFRDLLAEPTGVALRLRRFSGLGESFRPGDAEAIRAFVPPEARRDAALPETSGFIETTARDLARRMAAGDEEWLSAFLTDGMGAVLAALQTEGAAALASAGRGPLAGSS
jgi:hypothetical protein